MKRLSVIKKLPVLLLYLQKFSTVELPRAFLIRVLNSPKFGLRVDSEFVRELVGEVVMRYFTELGPIYGKAGRVALSLLPSKAYSLAEAAELTRLYNDWPAMSFSDVCEVLDDNIPRWRVELEIDPNPIGVASIGQVHRCSDKEGKVWALKVLKPLAAKRLLETVEACEVLIDIVRTLPLNKSSEKTIDELETLMAGFKSEVDLENEKLTIERFREKSSKKNGKVLKIPNTNDIYCTSSVLCLEYFEGTLLSDVVSNKSKLNSKQRQKLARGILKELLIQVLKWAYFMPTPMLETLCC